MRLRIPGRAGLLTTRHHISLTGRPRPPIFNTPADARWVTTWHDRATVYTVTDYVDEGGFILNDDDPAVVQFLATEREKLAEFSAVANTRGIREALVSVPEIR